MPLMGLGSVIMNRGTLLFILLIGITTSGKAATVAVSSSIEYIKPAILNIFEETEETSSRHTDTETSCTSDACKQAVIEIDKSTSKNDDPCEDFYSFACNGWEINNQLPSEFPVWRVTDKLLNSSKYIVADILQREETEADKSAIGKARRFYQSCWEEINMKKNKTLQFTLETLMEYGGWPILDNSLDDTSSEKTFRYYDRKRFNLMKSLAALQRKFAIPLVLDIYSDQSRDGNVSNNQIVLDRPPTNNLGSDLIKGIPKYLLMQFVIALLESQGETDIDKHQLKIDLIDGILNMQIGVAKQSLLQTIDSQAKAGIILSKELFGYNESSAFTTLDTLQAALDFVEKAGKSSLNLFEWLNNLYEDTGVQIERNEPILVNDIDYIFNLSHFLSSQRAQDLANYVHGVMVQDIISKSAYAATGVAEWKDYCIKLVHQNFYAAIMPSYVQQIGFTDLSQIEDIFQSLKNSLIDYMANSLYSEHIKAAVIPFAESLQLCHGYQFWSKEADKIDAEYADLNLEEMTHLEQLVAVNDWSTKKELKLLRSPFNVNKCDLSSSKGNSLTNIADNLIYLSLEMLQSPYIDSGLPRATLYGKLGSLMGQEIAAGLMFLAQKIPEEEKGGILTVVKCLLDQYSGLRITELETENLTINGNRTTAVNVADNVGLKLAYMAFKEAEASTPLLSGKPKELEQYSDDQLFFLGFAQNWCQLNTPEFLRKIVMQDIHTPGKYRVLGTLQNSHKFTDAWECSPGSGMNPSQHKKCNFFE